MTLTATLGCSCWVALHLPTAIFCTQQQLARHQLLQCAADTAPPAGQATGKLSHDGCHALCAGACTVATTAQIQATITPPSDAPTLLATSGATLPLAPPTVASGVCNANMPTDSTFNRYVWMVWQMCGQVTAVYATTALGPPASQHSHTLHAI